MASLKEIKGRIVSVRSTLKITSAMKMVASARLHKAQQAALGMLPYQEQLHSVLSRLLSSGNPEMAPEETAVPVRRAAVVAFSSNSSLCGAFNSNAIRELFRRVTALRDEGFEVEVMTVGKKMAEACKKKGIDIVRDCSELLTHNSYEGASSLAADLVGSWESRYYGRVELVYNHFLSSSSQKVVTEVYLPFTYESDVSTLNGDRPVIVEPSREEVIRELLSKVMRLKIYAVVLDTSAAEHAARTLAMQIASDNAERILQELTLEYNKGRQQKITAEILDIVGGTLR